MKTRTALFTTLIGSAMLAAQSVVATPVDAVMIDDFVSFQDISVSTTAPPTQTGFGAVAAGTAVGGERDLLVSKTAGADGEAVRARINPFGSNLLRMTQGETNGSVQVTWDGFDASSAINASGLGGIDLSAGLLDPFFEIMLTFSDVGGPIVLQVYEQGNIGNFAQATLLAPGAVSSGSMVLLTKAFSDFIVFGTSSLDSIFGNAGAVAMTIDATGVAQEGWDMRMDYVKTRGTVAVALPGSLLLLGLSMGLMHRRQA